jgi:hypothetical protein
MRHAIFLAAIVVIAINGDAAEPAPTASENPATVLEPVFDCYHANSAWGFTLSGKVIDNQGKIWSYGKHGQAWQPAPAKDGGAVYLTAKMLHAKFVEPKEAGSVDAKALQENCELIAKAGKGTLTRADTGVRDAGTSACHAYIRDAANERYQDIDLGSDNGVSDVRNSNDAPEAKVLLTWLQSVGVAN